MAAGESPSRVETPKEAPEDRQGGPPPSALKHWQKRGHDRGSGDQRPRFSGQRRPSTAAEPIRGKSDERKTGRGERFDIREKRSAERPPDPNSPFAKLLALKAQLEEQTKPEKDKQDS